MTHALYDVHSMPSATHLQSCFHLETLVTAYGCGVAVWTNPWRWCSTACVTGLDISAVGSIFPSSPSLCLGSWDCHRWRKCKLKQGKFNRIQSSAYHPFSHFTYFNETLVYILWNRKVCKKYLWTLEIQSIFLFNTLPTLFCAKNAYRWTQVYLCTLV